MEAPASSREKKLNPAYRCMLNFFNRKPRPGSPQEKIRNFSQVVERAARGGGLLTDVDHLDSIKHAQSLAVKMLAKQVGLHLELAPFINTPDFFRLLGDLSAKLGEPTEFKHLDQAIPFAVKHLAAPAPASPTIAAQAPAVAVTAGRPDTVTSAPVPTPTPVAVEQIIEPVALVKSTTARPPAAPQLHGQARLEASIRAQTLGQDNSPLGLMTRLAGQLTPRKHATLQQISTAVLGSSQTASLAHNRTPEEFQMALKKQFYFAGVTLPGVDLSAEAKAHDWPPAGPFTGSARMVRSLLQQRVDNFLAGN